MFAYHCLQQHQNQRLTQCKWPSDFVFVQREFHISFNLMMSLWNDGCYCHRGVLGKKLTRTGMPNILSPHHQHHKLHRVGEWWWWWGVYSRLAWEGPKGSGRTNTPRLALGFSSDPTPTPSYSLLYTKRFPELNDKDLDATYLCVYLIQNNSHQPHLSNRSSLSYGPKCNTFRLNPK